ncbi:helix-turn-helix transcriptional regulator [Aporhodopirellula aestuarii]|uniref:Helix-turn-helix domain-containing protein n=1 Tax=Aporhodopirellula aestuarii TaxID=2950107 RepID=A0ABT0U4S6_9BACT|nr:helix-turn-helix domain-containing protein [Aporhodopirellula aestuarii]MCM2371856.1 helix-turn-helix domain-containing protein [Aporhodopirellula aestuarii]
MGDCLVAISKENPATADGLWKRKDAAKYCGVTERTIDRWILSGVLPASAKVVIGGTVRFRPDVITMHVNSIECSPKRESEAAK